MLLTKLGGCWSSSSPIHLMDARVPKKYWPHSWLRLTGSLSGELPPLCESHFQKEEHGYYAQTGPSRSGQHIVTPHNIRWSSSPWPHSVARCARSIFMCHVLNHTWLDVETENRQSASSSGPACHRSGRRVYFSFFLNRPIQSNRMKLKLLPLLLMICR